MRFLSRISARLLLFNLLLVFLPAAGLLYLDVYERQLLALQERAMVQQGRLLAAELGGGEALDRAGAAALLRRLDRRTEARLRVVDVTGRVVADSSLPGPPKPPAARSPRERLAARDAPSPPARESRLYRLGALLYRVVDTLLSDTPAADKWDYTPRQESFPLGPEVRAALAGRYGAATRPSGPGQRSLTLAIAIPVRAAGGQVVGAVAVSQSTLRILAALVEVRLGIFKVILASVAAAVVLSLLFATTIARPLERLRTEALALVDRRGRLRGSFQGSRRTDEIGDLARALEQLTRRLESHLRFIEGFAADMSHEIKNPLAAIAGAAELLVDVDDPADRARFLALIQREVARLERLLDAVRDVSRLDAGLETEPAPPIDLAALVSDRVETLRQRPAAKPVAVALQVVGPGPVVVRAAPERLAQLIDNLLDNAASFSPEGGTVTVTLQADETQAILRVDDDGPGLPPEHLERVFDRFFTWRPGTPKGGPHAGLGLAICRAVAEGYGGTITAANRAEGGARFEVRLPVVG
jgi:two-component system sensor histidine kinase ChvG